MPASSPPSSTVGPREIKNDSTWPVRDGYEFDKRWPRRRGRYEIETQCSGCQWWFDSFDPSATKCRICSTPQPVEKTEAPKTPVPMPLVQQNEVPQAVPNPLPWFGTSVENAQLDWSTPPCAPGGGSTQYQMHGQDFGTTLSPPHSYGIISGPPAGYMPYQFWGQDYGISPNLPYSAGSFSNPVGGYTQNETYEQGYNVLPNPPYYPTTTPNVLGIYTPNQALTQEYDTPSNQSLYSGAAFSPQPAYIPHQTRSTEDPKPGNTSGQGVNMPSQGRKRRTKLGNTKTTTSHLRPLRPLLPREPAPDKTPSTATVQPRDKDNKRESDNKSPARQSGRLSENKSSGIDNSQSPKPNRSNRKKG
ncbi:hypothetical protein F4823DRAFT_398024 [Ustulina deusta]|nr:hypothetical protein F4823DRAFT_398024 [Ustulina deusta]